MSAVNIKSILGRINEWLFRSALLRSARSEASGADGIRERAVRQARLQLEAARRLVEPIEALPSGSRAAVILPLYRDAAYWALVAGLPDGQEPPPDLVRLWSVYPPERIPYTQRDPVELEGVRKALLDRVEPGYLAATDEDMARARGFSEALLWDLDAARRRVDRLLAQRWGRLTLVLVGLVALAIVIRSRAIGPDLAHGKPFRTSSTWSGWAGCTADGSCTSIMFHTETENEPWVEIDLGDVKPVRRVEIENRRECCADRAVPLAVELSTDRKTWTEVARREKEFNTWTAKFRSRGARYVRVRTLRSSVLHLKEIAVH